jgi:hypothetical protein
VKLVSTISGKSYPMQRVGPYTAPRIRITIEAELYRMAEGMK